MPGGVPVCCWEEDPPLPQLVSAPIRISPRQASIERRRPRGFQWDTRINTTGSANAKNVSAPGRTPSCGAALALEPVVLTFTANISSPDVIFNEDGLTLQDDSGGAPEQVRLTAPEKPVDGVISRLYDAVCPPLTMADVAPPAATPTE
jgi:hypothetical protein